MDKQHKAYWRKSLGIVAVILSVWFSISILAGIVFKEQLDQFSIGTAPLGFWMAQQGAIIGFVVLLVVYTVLMNRLDKKFGFDDEPESLSPEGDNS